MNRRSGSTALLIVIGVAAGLAASYLAWWFYNQDLATTSNVIVGVLVVTSVALVWQGHWRALGIGLLSSLALYVLVAALIFIWASGLQIS